MKSLSRYFVKTFGCTYNFADSQKIETLLENCVSPGNESNCKWIIVNTCGVKQNTGQKIFHYLRKLSEFRKKVIITGCLPFIAPKTLSMTKKAIPNYVAIVHPENISQIPRIIRDFEQNEKSKLVFDRDFPPSIESSNIIIKRTKGPVGILQISRGCIGNCTYCATKNARGKFRSFDFEDVSTQLESYLSMGKKEIWLTSQDCGIGICKDRNISRIYSKIMNDKRDYIVRIGMTNPEHLIRHFQRYQEILRSDRFFKFLHIPIQSGSDFIIGEMMRNYSREDVLCLFSDLRSRFPEISLATDIIVGFPEESQEDFHQTVSMLNEIRPDVTNISKFSNRPGTRAGKMRKIDTKIIKQRSSKISQLTSDLCVENNRKWINWIGRVFIDELGKQSTVMTRNPSYKCIVLKRGEIGTWTNVKIVGAKKNYCLGIPFEE